MGQPADGWGNITSATATEPTEKTKLTDEVSEPVFEVNTDAIVEAQCQQVETMKVQPTNTQSTGESDEEKKSKA